MDSSANSSYRTRTRKPAYTTRRGRGRLAIPRPEPLRDRLAADRAETLLRIQSLTAEYDGIVAAASGTATDDEHDPEGATLAFEREQLAALLDLARRHLADVEAADQRVACGSYGTCATCGQAIGDARLEARPTATTCIACAGLAARS
ncbi:MAG: TraR/DksA family transcriptional regulator [Actinomycetes bacterium]